MIYWMHFEMIGTVLRDCSGKRGEVAEVLYLPSKGNAQQQEHGLHMSLLLCNMEHPLKGRKANLETFHSLQNHHRAQATEIDHADLFSRLETEPHVLFAHSLFSPRQLQMQFSSLHLPWKLSLNVETCTYLVVKASSSSNWSYSFVQDQLSHFAHIEYVQDKKKEQQNVKIRFTPLVFAQYSCVSLNKLCKFKFSSSQPMRAPQSRSHISDQDNAVFTFSLLLTLCISISPRTLYAWTFLQHNQFQIFICLSNLKVFLCLLISWTKAKIRLSAVYSSQMILCKKK